MRRAATILAGCLALAAASASAQTAVDDLAAARDAFEARDFAGAYERYSALTGSANAAEALYVLSVVTRDGYGVVPADPEQALALLRRAADGGYGPAIAHLGMTYFEGDGVPQSVEAAKRLWLRGAELDDPACLYNLGFVQAHVTRDPAEAARWFERAAAAGDRNAMTELADLLDQGRGVPRDSARAVELWRRAAAAGDDGSRRKLAQAYFEGRGVPEDAVKAQAWALVAERDGDGISPEARNVIAARLTADQRAEAARLAERCLAAPTTDCP